MLISPSTSTLPPVILELSFLVLYLGYIFGIYINVVLYIYKCEKHFHKMYRDVGMAVPKTTETRCRDGSMQGRHVIQRLHN